MYVRLGRIVYLDIYVPTKLNSCFVKTVLEILERCNLGGFRSGTQLQFHFDVATIDFSPICYRFVAN